MKNIRKDNWEETKRRLVDWWNGKGCLFGAWGPVEGEKFKYGQPYDGGPAESLEQQWTDIEWRVNAMKYRAASMDCPLDTLPYFPPEIGPGTLALYLGSEAKLQPNTVWYEPCIEDPETYGKIELDPENKWWKFQLELIDRMIEGAAGEYYVGSPDLIENWDILASLRDAQTLMMDMIERPEWVKEKIAEINEAWFEAYTALYEKIRAQDGESMFGHFALWAPGKVAKVQCDGCAMFSPDMFREFVQPALREQCDWLDYSMYHLDGSQCIDKLDALLEIESLDAIEWTPDPKAPGGGDLHWVPMYQRILDADKRVQVLMPRIDQIEPLLDALGTSDGIYFLMGGDVSPKGWEQLAALRERLG